MHITNSIFNAASQFELTDAQAFSALVDLPLLPRLLQRWAERRHSELAPHALRVFARMHGDEFNRFAIGPVNDYTPRQMHSQGAYVIAFCVLNPDRWLRISRAANVKALRASVADAIAAIADVDGELADGLRPAPQRGGPGLRLADQSDGVHAIYRADPARPITGASPPLS